VTLDRGNFSVDLDALAANYHTIRAQAAGAEVRPVVKADGYGLGAAPVARRLYAEGARAFFVARLSEGEALRAALPQSDAVIHVLDGVLAGTESRLTDARLSPVLSSLDQARVWRGAPAPLHVDTGMNRLGVSADDALALAKSGFRPSLIMSHLGCAEDPDHPRNAEQLARFLPVRETFPDAPASLAASGGIFLGPRYRFEAVRPGISLYGGGPREVPDPRIRAVVTLTAPVLQIHDLAAGEAVGYGAMFRAPRAMRVAIVGMGYADGIIRASHRSAAAFLNGAPAPFAAVTMDLIALDIDRCPGVKIGDHAELLGANAPLDDLARASGSVAHECLVHLGRRAQRTYLGA
jgi:alanine racemase